MIDVHVLTHEGTRKEWLEQCLASLEGEPVNVFVVDNTGHSVGAGRAKGYALGASEFVSYVDSDDYVLPGCFAACLEALKKHDAVVTMERVEYENGTVYPFPRSNHAATVYRRKDVEHLIPRMASSAHTTDAQLRRLLRPTQIPFVGYVWRVHPDGDHHKVDQNVLNQETQTWPTQMAQR